MLGGGEQRRGGAVSEAPDDDALAVHPGLAREAADRGVHGGHAGRPRLVARSGRPSRAGQAHQPDRVAAQALRQRPADLRARGDAARRHVADRGRGPHRRVRGQVGEVDRAAVRGQRDGRIEVGKIAARHAHGGRAHEPLVLRVVRPDGEHQRAAVEVRRRGPLEPRGLAGARGLRELDERRQVARAVGGCGALLVRLARPLEREAVGVEAPGRRVVDRQVREPLALVVRADRVGSDRKVRAAGGSVRGPCSGRNGERGERAHEHGGWDPGAARVRDGSQGRRSPGGHWGDHQS